MARLVYIVTHPMTARLLLRGQVADMRRRGFEVTVVTAPDDSLEEVRRSEGATVLTLPLRRRVAPLADLRALVLLWRLLRRLRPLIVNASTPKAGLLGMVAARWAAVPVRIYTLRGLRLETQRGFARRLSLAAERLTAGCAQRIVCVSPSLRRRYLALGLTGADKIRVLASGSSNGVDLQRFDADDEERRDELRAALGLPRDAPVIGFVGRFTRDKGIEDLTVAFTRLAKDLPEARLLLVGDFEGGDPVAPDVRAAILEHPAVVRTGFVGDTAPYYGLMTVLAFPSYREGFPNAPLEAAAARVPTVGFAATGTVDAIEHGRTGWLVPKGDRQALEGALERALGEPARCAEAGRAARRRAEESFRQESIWDALAEEYRALLEDRMLPAPTAVADTPRPVERRGP